MDFEIVGKIYDIEIIAVGSKIRILPFLQSEFGRGRWRKLIGLKRTESAKNSCVSSIILIK